VERELRLVERPGVTVVIVNRGRVLLLKRISLPIIVNPGRWYFVGGAKKAGETPLQNAYREVHEELGLGRDVLRVISSSNAVIVDPRKKQIWRNRLFIMGSKTRKVRLNIEHTSHKWVTLKGLRECSDIMATVADSPKLFSMIKSALLKS
jgi:8-oxo-dGTP pyrophosphatase MutT (NUDIX family)